MSLKKGSICIFISNLINLLISLFTGFVLPIYLSVNTYSYIKLFQLYLTYIGVVSLGYADGMYLNYGGKKIGDLDKKALKDEFVTFKFFQLIISFLLIILSLICKNEIMFFCSLVVVPINTSGYLKNMYQAIGSYKLYSKFMNINTFLIFLVNLFLILMIKTDNYIVFLSGYVISYFCYLCYIEYESNKFFNYSKIKSKANFKYLIDDVKKGFLLMIGNFGNIIFTSIDRLFVKHFLGLIKFAFYSFAVSIENLVNIFVSPFSVVMYNYFCNHKKIEDVIKIKRLLLVFSAIVIIIVFPAKCFINLFLVKYISSIEILFFLVGAQFVSILIKCVHTNLYKVEGKQTLYFVTMIFVIVLSIFFDIIFYVLLGDLKSFAIATLITNILWLLIGEWNFKKYKLNFFSYLYMFLILALFLSSQYISNVYLSTIVYLFGMVILSLIFMKRECLYLINELRTFIKKSNRFI